MAQGPGEIDAPATEDIRSQIEQTRAEMSDTIDAIQTRLSPARAMAEAKDSVTEATVGRLKRLAQRTPGSGRSLLETARANRWPVALLATGAAALIVRARNNGKRRRPKAPRTSAAGGARILRERTNPVSRRGNRRLVAAATAAATCWAIWRAQTPAAHWGNVYRTAADHQDGRL